MHRTAQRCAFVCPAPSDIIHLDFAEFLDREALVERPPEPRFIVVAVRDTALVTFGRRKGDRAEPGARAVAGIAHRTEGRRERRAGAQVQRDMAHKRGDRVGGAVKECVGGDRRHSGGRTRGLGIEVKHLEARRLKGAVIAPTSMPDLEYAGAAREPCDEFARERVGGAQDVGEI